MREMITRCASCKREDCDGIMWKLTTEEPNMLVCTSRTFIRNGKRYYHFVMGHGNEWDIEVEEAKE